MTGTSLCCGERFRAGLLESLTKLTGIAVRAWALNHEDVRQPAHWINPRLGAPRAPMPESTWRKHCRNAFVWRAQHGYPDAPAIVGSVAAIFGGLQESGRKFSRLDGSK